MEDILEMNQAEVPTESEKLIDFFIFIFLEVNIISNLSSG